MDEMRQERGPLQENQEENRQENRQENWKEKREEIPRQIYRPRQPEEAAGTERERRKNESGQETVPEWNGRSPQKETAQQRGEHFGLLVFPTLLYAVIYTFLLYDNWASVTMPLFVAATAVYVFYIMKNSGVEIRKRTGWYVLAMALLGISDMLTGNGTIQFFNNLGIFLMLICMLLYNYFDVRGWGFWQYAGSILGAVCGALGQVAEPFSDGAAYFHGAREKKKSRGIYILLGLVIALPILAVVTGLLYSADAVFAQVLRETLNLNPATICLVMLFFLFAFFSAYCGMRYLGKKELDISCKERTRWEPLIAITVTLLVSVVYLMFSGIQIFGLFLGKMALPQGYTYAAYAREGFFQLLAVCLINLVMVLFIQGFFREHGLLKILLTVICGCTYIMAASSAMRMIMYVQVYHLTFLRVLVLWALAVIAILLAGILLQIWKKGFPLFTYGMAAVCVCYLALSFSHVDYFIARYNLAHMDGENSDYGYLMGLSTDAAPAIYDALVKTDAGTNEQMLQEELDAYLVTLEESTDDSIRQFNVSRYYARHLFGQEMEDFAGAVHMSFSNQTEGKIVYVTLHFYNGSSLIGSRELTEADGSSLTFDTIYGKGPGRTGFDFSLTRAELEQMGADTEDLSQLGISASFVDEDGNTCETPVCTVAPQMGNTYELDLYEDYDGTCSFTVYQNYERSMTR